MKRMTAAVAALLATLVSGCQFPPKAPDPASKTMTTKPSAEPAANVWERSRQCAEQAEKVVKREQARLGPDSSVYDSENHYSAKFERCYVRITYLFRHPNRAAGIPLFRDELSDAFENRILASFAEGVSNTDSSFCRVKDGSDDQTCRAARAFIDERMNK